MERRSEPSVRFALSGCLGLIAPLTLIKPVPGQRRTHRSQYYHSLPLSFKSLQTKIQQTDSRSPARKGCELADLRWLFCFVFALCMSNKLRSRKVRSPQAVYRDANGTRSVCLVHEALFRFGRCTRLFGEHWIEHRITSGRAHRIAEQQKKALIESEKFTNNVT